jgi:futalosine hydrolase
MKIVITSATDKEVILIKQAINPAYTTDSSKFTVSFHKSEIGILASCFSISKLIYERRPDLIIQAGIAGSFNADVSLGQVVAVKEEIPGDIGVEEDGIFKDLFDLNLHDKNSFPFSNKRLINTNLEEINYLKLDEVTGITINEITTRPERILQYKAKYNPAVESMEGASFHYCCLQINTSFIQIRAISNYIGERDKSKWDMKTALQNLTTTALLYIDELYKRNK